MKKNLFSSAWDIPLGLMICSVVFGYICLRASLISISHDEALTYLIHVHSSWKEILFHPQYPASNNHLLNTLFIKILVHWFGPSVFVLRIPALAGCLLYMAAGFKILRLFSKGLPFVVGLTLLITNPLMMDLFSCARGYSLALGFFMLALYYCFKRFSSNDRFNKNNYGAIGASTLSALSQISFVNTYFVIAYLLAFLQICLFLKEKDSEPSGRNSPLPILIALISSSLVLGLVYSPFVLGLMALPPYGGYDGFVKNTIASLGFDIFQRGSMNPIALSALVIGILLCILMALWGLIKSGSKGKYSTHHKFLFLTALLLIYISVLIKSEAIFIQILYPEGRTALYFLPLFFLFILLLPDNFNRLTGPLNKTANIAFYTLCSVIIFHGLCSINLNNFYIWEYDACTKKVLTFIGHEMKEHPKKKYTIGLNWVLEPSSNYYIIFWKMKQLKPASRKGPDGVYDFYYLLASDLDILKKYNLRVVKSYKLSGTFLAEPIH